MYADLEKIEEKHNPHGNNNSYAYEHGWSNRDIEIYETVLRAFENRQKTRTQEALEGDIIHIKDKTGTHTFYSNAMVIREHWRKTGFAYCESASAHVSLNQENTLPEYFSVSGGSFGNLDLKDLKYIGQGKRIVWTWGRCGACGNGGIYIEVPVNVYELIIDREYIPFEIYTMAQNGNNPFKYKYKLERRDCKNYDLNGSCFKKMSSLIRYLKNHNMIVYGHEKYTWRNILKVRVPENYKRVIVSDKKEFIDLLQKCDKSFAELRNGSYWRTCMINNTQYLPAYELEYFKLDYHACDEIYG